MPKRKVAPDSYSYDDDEDYVPSKSVKYSAVDEAPKKKKVHSLDSDEEEEDTDADNGIGDKSSNILQETDIEGQEASTIAFEGETTITPFNMKEEMEDGHFDGEGFYHFKKDSEQVKDAWLDDIDWVKVKHVEDNKNKYGSDEESDDGEVDGGQQSAAADAADNKKQLAIYEQMLEHLKPEETVQKALKRLGGGKKLTSAQKWKLKKQKQQQQPGAHPAPEEDMKAMLHLTELANKIVELGNMDVYQETHEMISNKLKRAAGGSEPAMDMFSESSEAEKAGEAVLGLSCVDEVRWQLRWDNNDDAAVEGPYSSTQLVKWQETGYLSKGAYVRKMGKNDSAWYHTNRIDFELYL